MTEELLLCVGGHADGQWITVKAGEEIYLLRQTWPSPIANPTEDLSTIGESWLLHAYVRTSWRGSPDGAMRFILTPHDQPPDETLRLLMDGYRKSLPHGRTE